jgi:hypothetical protein
MNTTSDWMIGECGRIFLMLGIRLLILIMASWFLSIGLLTLKKGWITESKMTLFNASCAIIVSAGIVGQFVKSLFISY